MEFLEGGRTGQILRDGDTVIRPSGAWTPTVHRFLRYVRSRGLLGVPNPIDVTDQDQEVVSYVHGRVCEDLSDQMIGSEAMLVSVAKLLREFHSASLGFLEADGEVQKWMLRPQELREIVCHGDFAPYNIATSNKQAVGIIDFDTAHPAPRLWDLAYAVYRWSPLSSALDAGIALPLEEQVRRANIFCTAYGTTIEERRRLPEIVCKRLEALVNFMRSSAEAGNRTFIEDIRAGDAELYLRDIEYVHTHRDQIVLGLQ
jgi:hypothetical protein